MPCKQSELITAINSFAAARSSNDHVLTNFSANLVAKLVDTLEFDPEEVAEEVTESETATPETVTESALNAEEPAEQDLSTAPVLPEITEEESSQAPVLLDPPVKRTRKRSSAQV